MQGDLFGEFSLEQYEKQARLMQAVDLINTVWGNDTLFFGAQGLTLLWSARVDAYLANEARKKVAALYYALERAIVCHLIISDHFPQRSPLCNVVWPLVAATFVLINFDL